MKQFRARTEILPEPQKRLWPELEQIPRTFILYGGTALALRLAHRVSVDFDFFSSERFSTEELIKRIPLLENAKILQNLEQTLTVEIERGGTVKLSFFGGLTMGRVEDPEETHDRALAVASRLDLAGMKAAVIQRRAEAKDYLDMLALIENGLELRMALAAAQALYPEKYNPMVTLKALSYFADGNLSQMLTKAQQERLANAASERMEIPALTRASLQISPVNDGTQ